MFFSQLTHNEKQIIFQCMNAMLKGNFLEQEFQTRLGIDEKDLTKVIDSFPEIDDSEGNSNETLAINNCLNEVCYGIRFSENEWLKWVTVNRDEVVKTYRNWAKLRGWKRTGII